MSTETRRPAGTRRAERDGARRASETLTVTDNRTGQTYELPIEDGTVRAMDLRQIKTDDDDFGLMAYDPAFMNTASCRSAITYIDGDAGHPPAPRLPDRAAVRALHLPRGRLPADQRRAADARRELEDWVARDHDPHVRARERQGLHAGLPLRRQPDGHAGRLGGRAVDLLPRRQQDPRRATSARSRSSGCSRRCRRSRRSPSATTWASPTSTPTTTSTTPATSSG